MAASGMLPDDELTRVSTTVAEEFTDAYYNALNTARNTISSFYVPPSNISPGRDLPLITSNGTQLSDPTAFQNTFEQMPYTHFEIQSLNAHVTNPSITNVAAFNGKPSKRDLEQNMSLLVQVGGYVRLVERKEGPMRGFSDTLVLVPNKEEVGGRGKAKSGEGRSWLIQTQNFRFTV
ncbi:hypothetical protein BDZ85DRAFT_283251 [Elsinoe ampelina]|uniref:NTF2 domain-containing protein n=1 Tax=Elsinoe ampelina TaxID=302913 RepID=A0A6A6G8R9_9PEZI|nr:hypothetical protein BDZ85DRAFT_283251 [Elsinoe ampelina]